MQNQLIFCFYKVQIDEWHKFKEQKKPIQEYFPKFTSKLKEITVSYITFDNRLADLLYFQLLHLQFNLQARDIILGIAKQLYKGNFISYRDLYRLANLKDQTIISKTKDFLQALKEQQILQPNSLKDEKLIKQKWEEIIGMNMALFWQLVILTDLKQPFLLNLCPKISVCSDMKNNKRFLKLWLELKKSFHSNEPQQSPQNIKISLQTHQFAKTKDIDDRYIFNEKQIEGKTQSTCSLLSQKEAFILERKIEKPKPKTPSKEQNKKLPQESKIIFFNGSKRPADEWERKPNQNLAKQPEKISPSLFQQVAPKNRWPTFEEYVNEVQRNGNKTQSILLQIAFNNSLFYDSKNQQLRKKLFEFIQLIMNAFIVNDKFKLEIFGSLRSQLALKDDYDIDLTYVSANGEVVSRDTGFEQLDNFKTNLIYNLKLDWVKNASVKKKDKLPPLLQLYLHEQRVMNYFQVGNMGKIDITACNDMAAANSQFMSHYAKIPQIGLFCLLVKLWAKSCNVINKYNPMAGLTGYGLLLMCLYFLMETQQINFLSFTQQQLSRIRLKSLVPTIEFKKFNGLAWNFTNFLNFYGQNGAFLRQNKIVCLLKNCPEARNYYQQRFIINMYDFMDKTNPGRLDLIYQQQLFSQFDRAYYIMIEGNPQQIQKMFTLQSERPITRRKR